MRPDVRFLDKSRGFWAYVRLISEQAGYSQKGKQGTQRTLKAYDAQDMVGTLRARELPTTEVANGDGSLTPLGHDILSYLTVRRRLLTEQAEPSLQTYAEAEAMFEHVVSEHPRHGIVLQGNRQAKAIQHPLFLANTVSILAEAAVGSDGFVPDPTRLVTFSDGSGLQRVLCRRLDGALPSTHNPLAVWECKEYYGTTTFGSRVADGIYETMLVGEELAELRNQLGVAVNHYLFVDDHYTWWQLGRSYLCRIVDAMHTGHISEAFFGREVLTRWPEVLESLRAGRLAATGSRSD